MSKLAIAFCGPNIALNESLAIYSKDLIYRESIDFIPVGNPLSQLGQITRRDEWSGADLDWMNLWACSLRRMTLESVRDQDVLISASHSLDQVAYQAMWLQNQMTRQASGLIGADGKPIMDPAQVMAANRSGASLQIIMNSAEQEAAELFDYTYAILPVTLTEEMSPEEAVLVAHYDDFITSVPAFQSSITRLPDNEDAAKDALSNEAAKWQKLIE